MLCDYLSVHVVQKHSIPLYRSHIGADGYGGPAVSNCYAFSSWRQHIYVVLGFYVFRIEVDGIPL